MINDKIIVALDFPQAQTALELTKRIDGLTYVKVGMELFYQAGAALIHELKKNNLKVFLDLKLHDIPHTVARTCEVLAKLQVDMVNVHAAGGSEMMNLAASAYKAINPKGKIIAVTQLTSTDEKRLNQELKIEGRMQEVVASYAKLAGHSGMDGVVCSAHEASAIKETVNTDFLCVTPGIRPKGFDHNDQARVMTPAQAIKAGSDFLVIGRAITQHETPQQIFNQILEEVTNE